MHIKDLPPQIQNLKLSKIAFLHELPAILGYHKVYVNHLVNPASAGKSKEEWHRSVNFPKPVANLSEHISVWLVEDLVQWAATHRTRVREITRSDHTPLVDNVDLIRELLGIEATQQ